MSLGLCLSSQYGTLLLLSANLDVEFTVTSPIPCLPVCGHASHHDNHRLSL